MGWGGIFVKTLVTIVITGLDKKIYTYVLIYSVWTQTLFALTLKDNSLKTAEILAATSTGAGEAKIKSSVGALFDFLPQAIKL